MYVKKILEADLNTLTSGVIHTQFTSSPESYVVVEYTNGDEGGISIYPRFQVAEYKPLRHSADVSDRSAWAYFYVMEQGTVPAPKSCVTMAGADEDGMFRIPCSAPCIQCGLTIECDNPPSAAPAGGSVKVFLVVVK